MEEANKKITMNIPRLVTANQNENILKDISLEEVEHASMEMTRGKSLRIDGFTIDFYHYLYPIIKKDFSKVVEES